MRLLHLTLCTVLFALLATGLGCGAGATSSPPATQAPLDASTYLLIETGTLPIVLSAPHGGTLEPPGVPVRTQGTTVLDTNTLELIQAVQTQLQALTGGRAHVVAARISRKFVDFNRTASEAYESPAVAGLYQAYQGALATAAVQVQGNPKALLLDLHGQGAQADTVFRGTRNGLTADLSGLYTGKSFLAQLSTRLKLDPAMAGGTENPDYNGGYLVATYGRSTPGGLNAVQLEFGFGYRATSADISATATRVAEALASHLAP